jgi:GntR family transcriptional regulator
MMTVNLKPRPGVPIHMQIEQQLAAAIAAGSLPAGGRLPAERELAEELAVSRMTVRQALTALAQRGLVERGVGRGTFVAEPKVEHDLRHVAGFTAQMERAGLEPGARLVRAAVAPAPPAVAAALGLEPGAPAARIQRVRSGAGRPLTLEDSWLPDALFPGLCELDLGGSLYALMRDRFGRGPVRAIERLEPVAAGAAEARALGVARRSPLMLVERTAYAADGAAVEYARDRHRGDRARFVVEVAPEVPRDG